MNSRICCFGVLVRLLALLVVAVCFEIVLGVGLCLVLLLFVGCVLVSFGCVLLSGWGL